MSKSDSQEYLFEYQNRVKTDTYPGFDLTSFISFLNKIWQEREKSIFYRNLPKDDTGTTEADFDKDLKSEQQFISVFNNDTIKSRNYVGIIHFQGITFNLLPKIFYKNDATNPDLHNITQNILWWLSYSKRLNVPKLHSNYNKIQTDSFFEILIYLFTNYTRDLLTRQIYQHYTEVDRELPYLKGRLNMNTYIRDNLLTGNWAKLNCTYDSFEIDNHLNRIIKSVCRLLLSNTTISKQKLQEIVFLLDEVSDIQATAADCERVKINPLFSEMQTVLDYCKLFLSNSMVFTWKNELKVFAFLLPMEKVFEEFISGFLEKHKARIFGTEIPEIKSQSKGTYLTEEEVYELLPDIMLKFPGNPSKSVIADTKYKLTYLNDNIPAQGDMYQMVSYAIRHNCNDIKLLYPLGCEESLKEQHPKFSVVDILNQKNETISISIHKLPIIGKLQNNNHHLNTHDAEGKLIECLTNIFS